LSGLTHVNLAYGNVADTTSCEGSLI
jgi:hypothetical protein